MERVKGRPGSDIKVVKSPEGAQIVEGLKERLSEVKGCGGERRQKK